MITKEQYGEWRNHPATLFFRQFLKDRARQIGEQSHEAWLNGQPAQEVNRGRILELLDVSDVPFEFIESFYEEQNSATETNQVNTV